MGDHTPPIPSSARPLHPWRDFGGLMLLCLMGFWLLASLSPAHAVTLPYNESFDYNDGDTPPAVWQSRDQTTGEWVEPPSYHDIWDQALRIESAGFNLLENYYTVYLDGISGDFTATVQVTMVDNASPSTIAGLIIQHDLGNDTNDKAQVQMTVNRSYGYLMFFDDNGDGVPDAIFYQPTIVDPPHVWLRIVRSGNNFTGLYSTDGAAWTALRTVTSTQAGSILDVGLFGNSGDLVETSTAEFDNFSLVGSATTLPYFEDFDGDGFGNPSASIISTSATPPSGYVVDNTDCDDTDDKTYPGATELCDGKDNNCDGTIDEGLSPTTFYRDADGDGYGTAVDTHQGCIARAGYVATPGDCNDNNSLINPGVADICGNNIDEDCSGGDATCFSDTICDPISDVPLSVTVGGSPGIIMFILDDSDSMEWSVMCAEDEGRFNGLDEYTANYCRPRWKSQYHGYNRVYYNPDTDYEPWPKSQSHTFSDATFTNVPKHPLGFPSEALKNEVKDSSTLSLTHIFDTYSGFNVTFGHYYMVSTVNSQPYLVDLGIDSTGPVYYKVTQSKGDADDHYRTVKSLAQITPSEAASKKIAITGTFAEARTNFANWFTYHRTREIATKAALGFALQDLSGVKVGIHTMNHSATRAAQLISSSADVEALLDYIYKVTRKGPTPMRLALEDVGKYFDADDGDDGGIGPNPFDSSADGGDCQQAFAILMTDGYGNGGAPAVGNADADNNTKWDGSEFYGKNSSRLPDVAMYYYERDLAKNLADNLPVQDPDYEAPHQRMVTYTVSFGVKGYYSQADYPNCPPAHPANPIDCPTWLSGGTNEAKVDELWHAAVNGRGEYISTGTPQELSDAINSVLNDITRRIGTAASVAVSSEKLETGLIIYQGYFDSGDWSGNLEAYDVDPDGTVNLTAKWSAKAELNAANWDTGRTILTRNDATAATKAFRHANLSTAQKGYLTTKQLDYIRGDSSNEQANGGALRNRNHKLGDITHSAPILHKGVVYVGANDGMFHAFDATNGEELFAYVPSFVYPNLSQYTSPSYVHKFYADGTATARTVTTSSGSEDWVVSGLRKGGRGFFGINVTSPKTISESALPSIWEYPTAAAPDDDMGFTYGEVTIARSNTGDQLVFAANGYDSPNGHAVLMILNLDGTLFKKIDTGVGGTSPGTCNGLSDPLVVDLNDDGKADTVYAGDLMGNLWKFNVSSTNKDNWDVDYKSGSDSKPLFTAKNSTGQSQPITSKPAAMFHCDATQKGIMVVFATGRMLSNADLNNTNVQTIYGIWDWQAEWAENGISDTTPYHMGTFNAPSGSPAVRTLANIDGNTLFPSGVDLTLLQQTQVSADDSWRYTSNNPIKWFNIEEWLQNKAANSSYTGGVHVGWYLNLPDTKERVITKTQIRDGKAYVVSIIPEPAPCASGGTTIGSILNACNGGQLQEPQWDTNDDGIVDSRDNPPSGKKFDDDIYYAPAIIEDKLFFTKERVEETADEIRGLFYWRIRE